MGLRGDFHDDAGGGVICSTDHGKENIFGFSVADKKLCSFKAAFAFKAIGGFGKVVPTFVEGDFGQAPVDAVVRCEKESVFVVPISHIAHDHVEGAGSIYPNVGILALCIFAEVSKVDDGFCADLCPWPVEGGCFGETVLAVGEFADIGGGFP